MQQTVLISLPVEDLQTIIIDCVNSCLLHGPNSSRPVILNKGEIINRAELCKRLDITEPTAIRWEKRGKIPTMRIGSAIRYNWQAVIDALESKKVAR